ncbi:hypothetical protein P3G55_11765 [Leptospira sp. 96542]|nr:hypothetical protein [Leptospira sp. 96542]
MFRFAFLCILTLLNFGCKEVLLTNPCDPNGSIFQNTVVTKFLLGDWSPTCNQTFSLSFPEMLEYNIPSLGVKGVITGNQIVLASENNSIGSYVAAFKTNASSVFVDGIPQENNVTSNSYLSPLKYVLFGEGGASREYTVVLVAPRALGSGSLRIWLMADKLSLNDGAGVSVWNDQSGYANHLEQSVLSQQPIFRMNQVNGYPSLHFNDVSDSQLIKASGALGLYGGNDSGSFFAVFKYYGGNPAGITLLNLQFQYGRELAFSTLEGFFVQCVNGLACANISTLSAITPNYFSLASVQTLRTRIREYRNGVLVGDDTNPTNLYDLSGGSQPDSYFVSNGNMDGEIAEILYFHTDLSEDEIQKVFFYLNTKYNLPK